MKLFFILIPVVAISVITVGLTACNKKKVDKKTSEISTDVAGLSKKIDLPYQPIAVWWQEIRIGTPDTPFAPGPNDWTVNAVLLFDKKDIESILHKSQFEQQPEFPESIIKDFPEIDNLLKYHGTFENKLYKADLFGLSNGFAIRIKDTNKLFVSYTTR